MIKLKYIFYSAIACGLYWFCTTPPKLTAKVVGKIGPCWSCEYRLFGDYGKPGYVVDIESFEYKLVLLFDDGSKKTINVDKKSFDSVQFKRTGSILKDSEQELPEFNGRPSRIKKYYGISIWKSKF